MNEIVKNLGVLAAAIIAAALIWVVWGHDVWRNWCQRRYMRSLLRMNIEQSIAMAYPETVSAGLPLGEMRRYMQELQRAQAERRIAATIAALEQNTLRGLGVDVAAILREPPRVTAEQLQELVEAAQQIQAVGGGNAVPADRLNRLNTAIQAIRDVGVQA